MAVTVPKRAWGQRSFLPPPPREGWTIEVRGHCFQEDRPKDRRVDVPCPDPQKGGHGVTRLRSQVDKVWIVGNLATDTILPRYSCPLHKVHPPSGTSAPCPTRKCARVRGLPGTPCWPCHPLPAHEVAGLPPGAFVSES